MAIIAAVQIAEIMLDTAALDRVDAIVLPGTNINAADAGYQPPVLTDTRMRRRA